jgi:salicylate hydroxylase
MYHLPDGVEQETRDRILNEATWVEKPEGEKEGWIWIDVRYQKMVVGRDAIGDARKGWEDLLAIKREG